MSTAWQYYIITLLVYFGVNLIAGWSLNLQYGIAGIQNFAFILFQSVGAYVAGITTLGHNIGAYGETVFFSTTLPWPFPLVLAFLAGALVAAFVGTFALRPMSRELQAIVMIMVVIIAAAIVEAQGSLLNGTDGIDGVPKPMQLGLGLGLIGYGWFFVALTAALCLVVFVVINRITSSPYGRTLRAIRENSIAAEALAVHTRRETMWVFIFGGAIAALSGGILVEFIGAWSPAAWGIFETFLYLVAITVGGIGNNGGVALGTAIVLTGILEGVEYLPALGTSSLSSSLQLVGVAVLILLFLWFRPQGLLPERRRRLAGGGPLTAGEILDAAAAQPLLAGVGAAPPTGLGQSAVSVTSVPGGTGGGVATLSGPAEEPSGPPAGPDRLRTPVVGQPGDGIAAGSPILQLEGVTKGFGGLQAVNGVSFSVPAGLAVGLIGPNGAGKTTLINMIAGLEHPDSGKILYAGHDISRSAPHRNCELGLVRTFQLSSEFHHLTVLENMLVASPGQRGNSIWQAMRTHRSWRADERGRVELARALLERFQLTKMVDSYAGEMSGGQKRLLEIARALMARPRVLVLDEPLAGVAPGLRVEVEDHLNMLRNEGLTMLMCEHDLDTVERCTDTVIVMALGQVLASGTMDEIRRNEQVIDAYLAG